MNVLNASAVVVSAQALADTVNALNIIRNNPGSYTLAQAAAALAAARNAQDDFAANSQSLLADSQNAGTTQLP